jgi:hypothetical protein
MPNAMRPIPPGEVLQGELSELHLSASALSGGPMLLGTDSCPMLSGCRTKFPFVA